MMSAEQNPFRRTILNLRPCPEPIGFQDKSLWLGSCFTENMAPWLSRLGYPAMTNPFGVIYHPLIMEKLLFSSEADIQSYNFLREDVWLNYLLGAPFAAESEQELNLQTAKAVQLCRQHLEDSNWLVLTFGTAFLYHHHKLGPVGKCHKIPAEHFEKRMSSVEEISWSWMRAIQEIRKSNPGLRVLFSLSPVRHSRDGLEENALSKATLLLAINTIRTQLPGIFYFPAWEIMNDELRDYRFYAPDLVHPSEEAIRYLRACFEKAFLRKDEDKIRRLGEEIYLLESHRPAADWTKEAITHRQMLESKKAELRKLLPSS